MSTPGIQSVSTQLSPAVPASNALVTVPTTTKFRVVFGFLALVPAAVNPAEIQWYMETGVGTGVYESVVLARKEAAAETVLLPYAFVVPAGRRYRYVTTGPVPAGTGVSDYSYVDVA